MLALLCGGTLHAALRPPLHAQIHSRPVCVCVCVGLSSTGRSCRSGCSHHSLMWSSRGAMNNSPKSTFQLEISQSALLRPLSPPSHLSNPSVVLSFSPDGGFPRRRSRPRPRRSSLPPPRPAPRRPPPPQSFPPSPTRTPRAGSRSSPRTSSELLGERELGFLMTAKPKKSIFEPPPRIRTRLNHRARYPRLFIFEVFPRVFVDEARTRREERCRGKSWGRGGCYNEKDTFASERSFFKVTSIKYDACGRRMCSELSTNSRCSSFFLFFFFTRHLFHFSFRHSCIFVSLRDALFPPRLGRHTQRPQTVTTCVSISLWNGPFKNVAKTNAK